MYVPASLLQEIDDLMAHTADAGYQSSRDFILSTEDPSRAYLELGAARARNPYAYDRLRADQEVVGHVARLTAPVEEGDLR